MGPDGFCWSLFLSVVTAGHRRDFESVAWKLTWPADNRRKIQMRRRLNGKAVFCRAHLVLPENSDKMILDFRVLPIYEELFKSHFIGFFGFFGLFNYITFLNKISQNEFTFTRYGNNLPMDAYEAGHVSWMFALPCQCLFCKCLFTLHFRGIYLILKKMFKRTLLRIRKLISNI